MILGVVLYAIYALVPLGLLYGVITRIVLVRRQRSARQSIPEQVDGRAQQASVGRTEQQILDRRLNVCLLLIGGYLVALSATTRVLDARDFVFGNTTALGNSPGVAGDIGSLGLVGLIIAIPLSAVLITRRIRDRPLLLGEAYALRHRSDHHRRVRIDRALSWITFSLYAAGAILAIMTTAPLLYPT